MSFISENGSEINSDSDGIIESKKKVYCKFQQQFGKLKEVYQLNFEQGKEQVEVRELHIWRNARVNQWKTTVNF